jgi:hypothetical protein
MITLPFPVWRLLTGDTLPPFMTSTPGSIGRTWRTKYFKLSAWVYVSQRQLDKATRALNL